MNEKRIVKEFVHSEDYLNEKYEALTPVLMLVEIMRCSSVINGINIGGESV